VVRPGGGDCQGGVARAGVHGDVDPIQAGRVLQSVVVKGYAPQEGLGACGVRGAAQAHD
jgi:hypothetical protein